MCRIYCTNIKSLRKTFGYTQKDLAQIIGVSIITVQKWERGETTPSMEALISLSNVFLTSIDSIVGNNIQTICGTIALNADEYEVLDLYRKLDDRGKSLIQSLLLIECKLI